MARCYLGDHGFTTRGLFWHVGVKVVATVSSRRGRLTGRLRGGARHGRNPFACVRKGVGRGAVVLVRYNVNGIGTTTKAIRLVHGFRPSYVVDAKMTKKVSAYLGIVSMMIDRRVICRSM